MFNHFHILITQVNEGGISKFMHKVSSRYSHYYNKKYGRKGVLFESKFKSQFVEDDSFRHNKDFIEEIFDWLKIE